MRWVALVPLVGLLLAVTVPLWRYARTERDEQVAIAVLHRVREAQDELKRRTGGYAVDVATLMTACTDGPAVLPSEAMMTLERAGYVMELRKTANATSTGHDCQGRDLASEYYVATAPRSPEVAARQAFAARSDGRLHLFYDGIPPREDEIDAGLATPLEARQSFRIP